MIALLWALFAFRVAMAEEAVGIKVTLVVTDVAGAPIPTAVVRHPAEQDRHRVNVTDGHTDIDTLYLPDGSKLEFTKGMEIEFEISAPGYRNAHVTYVVRKRRNVVPVTLEKMDLSETVTDEDPEIQFGRDKPID
jgi:hypothetical protein